MSEARDANYDVTVGVRFSVHFKTTTDTAEEAEAIGLAILHDAELRSATLNPDEYDPDAKDRRCFSWHIEGPKRDAGLHSVWVRRSDEWRAANEPEAHVYELAAMADRLRKLEENRAVIPERARPILDQMIAGQRKAIDDLVLKLMPLTPPLPFGADKEGTS